MTGRGARTSIGPGSEHGDPPASGPWPDGGTAEIDPPVEVVAPDRPGYGLILSSPHSGCLYPRCFLESARLDAATLRRSEDAFVDELFLPAVAYGVPLLRARFPRAYLDVNREPYELDPRMFEGRLPAYANTRSVRVAGGLGTIARIVGDAQEIYGRRLSVEEGLARIEALHKPYHATLRRLIDEAALRFGRTLLIDCHSMPSAAATPSGRDERPKADFVIGDRHGTSCARVFTEAAERRLRDFGYTVERNKPYAGGYITEHYGTPALDRHALQIEINRSLYMDERNFERNAAFDAVSRHMTALIKVLIDIMDSGFGAGRLAAE